MIDAWQGGDWPKLIAMCVAAEGGRAVRTTTFADGPGWSFLLDGVPVLAAIRPAGALARIESPVARLPRGQGVIAMRIVLELGAAPALCGRACLRGDLLVARHVAPLEALPPAALRRAIREVPGCARRWGDLLQATAEAGPATASSRRAAPSWEVVGTARRLELLQPMSGVDAHGDVAPPRSGFESIPPVLAPALAATHNPAPAPEEPAAASHRATLHDIVVDPAIHRPPSTPPPPADQRRTPEEDLCDLLRHAQALATALRSVDKPSAGTLLVRAAVFRAVFEHGDNVPDAVAHFYRATQGALREGVQARRKSAADLHAVVADAALRPAASDARAPVAEPALLIMDRIVRSRAVVPKERPLVVDPLTTAADAKAHMARYLQQIERAPEQPALRHFLALGALAELMARTKLPAATAGRLREIVAHAQRDGERSNELLMRTIAKIAGAA
jgi:hypothetical protein